MGGEGGSLGKGKKRQREEWKESVVEVCVLGWTGVVPFRLVFTEKTPKNEVFRQGLRMGRVASFRHILMNFHI